MLQNRTIQEPEQRLQIKQYEEIEKREAARIENKNMFILILGFSISYKKILLL